MSHVEYHVIVRRPMEEVLTDIGGIENLPVWRSISLAGGLSFETVKEGTRIIFIGGSDTDSLARLAAPLVRRLSTGQAFLPDAVI